MFKGKLENVETPEIYSKRRMKSRVVTVQLMLTKLHLDFGDHYGVIDALSVLYGI